VNEKILIVDDEPRVVRLVSAVLQALNYQVIAATNGDPALEMVALEQPDLVLLDIRLPGDLDGYGVCRRIREFSDVAVIMLTVKVRGEKVPLTRTEYSLLRQLALNANRVLLHQELLTEVWGAEYRDYVDYLRAYSHYLRRKLEADPSNPRYILTSPGVGYMLACPEGEHQ